MRSKRLRIGLIAVALLALGLAGCGGRNGSGVATAGGGKNNKPSASAQPGDRDEQMRKFAACMRAHGVDMPDPQSDTGSGDTGSGVSVIRSGDPGKDLGPDSPTFKAAQEACRSLAPNGGDMPKPNEQQLEQMRKFAACMRAHGVDIPDPDPDGGGITVQSAGPGPHKGPDPNDPTFKAAQEACRNLLPSGGPGGPGSLEQHGGGN
jgi:hypothetical protein